VGKLEEKLAALENMSPAQLRDEWQYQFGETSPWAFGPDLLARGIAYRLQERAFGGLPNKVAREIARGTVARGMREIPMLRPGTRLARDWHGRSHLVTVTDTGFRYRDQKYRSLTAIAREITGAGWSGPRFFGLMSRGRANG
jgi:hypothetical protein